MAQKYTIRDREAGNIITTYDTFEEALAALKEFEAEDERNGEYTPDFYEIVTPFDEFMLDAGMSIKELSDRFGVPYRTVQNWANHGTNHRPCPDYIINMMREILG